MFDSKKLVKAVSVVVASMGLLSVSASVSQAANFTLPKLAAAQEKPTDPAIKKGDKVFVVIKDTKNQEVNVLTSKGKKTDKKVAMGSVFTAKEVKKVNNKKIVKIKKDQWLNTKDLVKD